MISVAEPCTDQKLGQQCTSISAFSRYPIPVLAVFLNGVARISVHQATCAGERMPMVPRQ